MGLQICKSPQFLGDIGRQVDWYREKENSEIADRFVRAVQATVEELAPGFLLWDGRDFLIIHSYAGFGHAG